MSDTRFTIIGILLIFVGFLVLGIFGGNFQSANIEMAEFGDCFEYSDNNEPIPINCSYKSLDQTIFFSIVVVLITAGVISLIKGVRGKWDNQVKSEDMVGPGGDKNPEKEE
ncbi:MAG: hypothetical protein OEL69_06460 [Nitrosopumilus sp.]|nr:hypothetical protein [Nitrosopumilus sp.]